MTIQWQQTLRKAIEEIQLEEEKEWFVADELRTLENGDELIEKYGKAKWAVVDYLNERYKGRIKKIDLHHWIEFDKSDEVAYFLNEAGSNCLNYAEYKIPYAFRVWSGKKGFVIGVIQKGKSFDAFEIDSKRIKENEGAAFTFFRECKNVVFFDNPSEARVVYLEVKL